MFKEFLQTCRRSLQLKLFLALTASAGVGLALILFSQVYLTQDYLIHQAEADLRNSNYLLSQALAEPLYTNDPPLLQQRVQAIQATMRLCNLRLANSQGQIMYAIGKAHKIPDVDIDPNSHDGCFNTIIPVTHNGQTYGFLRYGVHVDHIAEAQQQLIQQSILIAAFWFVLLMIPFFLQIRRMVRPLQRLSESAQQFTQGNFNSTLPNIVPGHDEVSQLTADFNGMANALRVHKEYQQASFDELSDEKARLQTLLATLPVGVFFSDRTRIRYCNEAFRKMWNISPDDQLTDIKNDALLLRAGSMVTEPEDFLKTVSGIIATRTPSLPKDIVFKDGRVIRMVSNAVPSPHDKGYLGRFWLFHDVTEEQNALQQAQHRAERDSLTLLYNRQRFDDDLARLFAQAQRDETQLALLIFDLDNFKPINDTYGHAAGDTVLQRIAQALSMQLRRNEVLYRVGGDEFAVLLPNASENDVAVLADRIVSTIQDVEFMFGDVSARIGCSLGIARYPFAATCVKALLKHADQAMYQAKQRGKNNWATYPDLH